MEQYQILGLSAALIFFNDPFYSVAVLQPSFGTLILSIVSFAIFVAGLVTFWLSVNFKVATPLEKSEQAPGFLRKFRALFNPENRVMKGILIIIYLLFAVAIIILGWLQFQQSQI